MGEMETELEGKVPLYWIQEVLETILVIHTGKETNRFIHHTIQICSGITESL